MSTTLTYVEGGAGAVLEGHGIVTGEELWLAGEEIYSEERIDTLVYQLVDFTRAERFDFGADEVRAMARQDVAAATRNPRIIIAIAGDTDLIFGLARIWEAHVGGVSKLATAVCRTRVEAEAWIAANRPDRLPAP